LAATQAELFPSWRYHAFTTDRMGTAVELDADHRRHAVVELAIRDLKEGAGLEHCPSGDFNANAAWAVLASLAHNLVRWVRFPRKSGHGLRRLEPPWLTIVRTQWD
jgi:hypothetical protein